MDSFGHTIGFIPILQQYLASFEHLGQRVIITHQSQTYFGQRRRTSPPLENRQLQLREAEKEIKGTRHVLKHLRHNEIDLWRVTDIYVFFFKPTVSLESS